MFIKEVFDDPSENILITRPRRWGKTLNMDMLKDFLEIEATEKGDELESGLRSNWVYFKGGKVNIEDTGECSEINIAKEKLDIARLTNLVLVGKLQDFDTSSSSYKISVINHLRYIDNANWKGHDGTGECLKKNILSKIKDDGHFKDNLSHQELEVVKALYDEHYKKIYDGFSNNANIASARENLEKIEGHLKGIKAAGEFNSSKSSLEKIDIQKESDVQEATTYANQLMENLKGFDKNDSVKDLKIIDSSSSKEHLFLKQSDITSLKDSFGNNVKEIYKIYNDVKGKLYSAKREITKFVQMEIEKSDKLTPEVKQTYSFYSNSMGKHPVIFITFSNLQGIQDKYSQYENLVQSVSDLIDKSGTSTKIYKGVFPSSIVVDDADHAGEIIGELNKKIEAIGALAQKVKNGGGFENEDAKLINEFNSIFSSTNFDTFSLQSMKQALNSKYEALLALLQREDKNKDWQNEKISEVKAALSQIQENGVAAELNKLKIEYAKLTGEIIKLLTTSTSSNNNLNISTESEISKKFKALSDLNKIKHTTGDNFKTAENEFKVELAKLKDEPTKPLIEKLIEMMKLAIGNDCQNNPVITQKELTKDGIEVIMRKLFYPKVSIQFFKNSYSYTCHATCNVFCI
jgi:hypothetical protein